MGIGQIKSWLSSKSNSSSGSGRYPASTRPPLGPGSSKADYAYGLNQSSSSTSPELAQGYYDGSFDLPPSYYSERDSDTKKWPAVTNMPTSRTGKAGAVYNPIDSMGETPLKALVNRDITVIFDDSWSMLTADGKGRRTRWDQAWDALTTLVRVGSKYDRDGIEIHFLNKREEDKVVRDEADLQCLRNKVGVPGSNTYTPIGDVLDTLLLEYGRKTGNRPGRPGVKKIVFLVITDGAATDTPEDAIIRAAKFFECGKFPLDQVGIQFIQVGNDSEATKFLEELDECLAQGECNWDMVDTIKSTGNDLEGDALIKALTGGFNRKQDKVGEQRR